MKFEFYIKGKKKKTQVIKADKYNDYVKVATIAKCEITKENILSDLDFPNDSKLYCRCKDNEFNMKDLYNLISSKLRNTKDETEGNKSNKKKTKDKKKKKKPVEKKKPVKKKDKKKKKEKKTITLERIKNVTPTKEENPKLIHITRR